MSAQGQGEHRASPNPELRRARENRGAAGLWVPLGNCWRALKKAPACMESRPLTGAWLDAFCLCLGFAVGCSRLPTASPAPAAERGPP